MQRNKTFLVVCVSIVITRSLCGQNFPSATFPGLLTGLPESSAAFAGQFGTLPGHDHSGDRTAGPSITAISFASIPGPGIQLSPLVPAWNSFLYLHAIATSPNNTTFPSLQAMEDVQVLGNDYYAHHLGFFCKKELEFEKTTRIPLRFRLGSLEQCNYLEGK
jgi:hypothetical protein